MGGRFFDEKNHLWENASDGDMAEVCKGGMVMLTKVKGASLPE